MKTTNPAVDAFLSKAKTWQDEFAALREIALGCALTEELKWGKPCYTFQGSNVAIIQGFKESCALLFCQGALLQDSAHLLEAPGIHSQAARRVCFTSVQEIAERKGLLRAYLLEAVEAEKAGLKVEYKKTPEPVPAELQAKLDREPSFRTAFAALTPGRQRAYVLHFSAAKQSKTREARIEKCTPDILAGKGWQER